MDGDENNHEADDEGKAGDIASKSWCCLLKKYQEIKVFLHTKTSERMLISVVGTSFYGGVLNLPSYVERFNLIIILDEAATGGVLWKRCS